MFKLKFTDNNEVFYIGMLKEKPFTTRLLSEAEVFTSSFNTITHNLEKYFNYVNLEKIDLVNKDIIYNYTIKTNFYLFHNMYVVYYEDVNKIVLGMFNSHKHAIEYATSQQKVYSKEILIDNICVQIVT